MKISLNSSLFRVPQPDTYWQFEGFIRGIEDCEMENLEYDTEEEVEVREEHQLWLVDENGKQGGAVVNKVARKDLPKDHPDHVSVPEYVYLDHAKTLKVISKCWVENLEEWIAARYEDMKRKNPIKVRYTGHGSPREYNFGGDWVNFDLTIPKKELVYIMRLCFTEHREMFETYLKEAHSSYDGYMSFVSNNIYVHEEALREFKAGKYDEHLIWVCLDFWLFGMEQMFDGYEYREDKPEDGDKVKLLTWLWGGNQDRFLNWLYDKLSDADGNGEFNDAFVYGPVEEVEVA